jgi:hypothetical protein
VDVELTHEGPAGNVGLVLVVDVGLVEGATTAGADVGQRGFVGLVDAFGCGGLAMTVGAMLVAGLASGGLGLGLGWSFGERRRLAFAGTDGSFELLAEVVAGPLQSGEGAFELLDAGVQTLVLGQQIVVGRSSHADTSTQRTTLSCE